MFENIPELKLVLSLLHFIIPIYFIIWKNDIKIPYFKYFLLIFITPSLYLYISHNINIQNVIYELFYFSTLALSIILLAIMFIIPDIKIPIVGKEFEANEHNKKEKTENAEEDEQDKKVDKLQKVIDDIIRKQH